MDAAATSGVVGKSSSIKRQKTEIKRTEEYKLRPWHAKMDQWPDDKFKKHFRISKDTFEFVCKSVKDEWASKQFLIYPVRESVAIALWRLANGQTDVQCINQFGIDLKAFANINKKVYGAIESVLKENYLRWTATEEDQARIKSEFEKLSSIQNIIGSVHTTHLRLARQKGTNSINPRATERYGNRTCTIPVQGVVDSEGKFIHIYCEDHILGIMTDDEVFTESNVSKNVELGDYIVGGETYPLDEKLMVPYKLAETLSDEDKAVFNRKLVEVQNIATGAFGELLGRWSLLQKPLQVDLKKIPSIVRVCCILHNICKEMKDELNGEFTFCEVYCLTPIISDNPTGRAQRARDSIVADFQRRRLDLCGGLSTS